MNFIAEPASVRASEGPMRVRALFLSDIHLGSRGRQADKLLAFLREYDAHMIYLVGDIVDGWQLKATFHNIHLNQ